MQIVTDPTFGRMAWTTTRDPDDRDDEDREDEVIRQPDIRINRAAVRDWLNPYRKRAGTKPITHCALCPEPPSIARWLPWHPAMALLCSRHRAELYNLACQSADRYRLPLGPVLTNLLNALIRIDLEIEREIN